MKRIFTWLLIAAIAISLLPISAAPVKAVEEQATTEGRPNLVGNGSFENELDGKTETVGDITVGETTTYWNPNANAEVSLAEGVARTGTKSVLVSNTTSGNTTYAKIVTNMSVKAGNTYRIIVYSKIPENSSATPSLRVGSEYADYVAANVGADGWCLHQYDYVCAADGTVAIYMYNKAKNDSFYFDDFAIYNMSLKYKTYTWKNYDGEELYTQTVEDGADVPSYAGKTPSRETDDYEYTFDGWSELDAESMSFTAQYQAKRVKKLLSGGDFEAAYTGNETQVITQLTFNGKSYNLTSSANASTSELSSEEGTYRSGKQSVKLQSGKETGQVNAILLLSAEDLEQGHTYKVSVYSKKDTEVGRALIARVYKDDSSHNGDITATTTEVDGWILHELNFTYSSTDAGKVYIYFRNTTKNGTVCYFDDFAIYDLTVASVGNAFYTDFSDAVAAALDSENALVLNQNADTITVPDGQTLKLDLNGHDVTTLEANGTVYGSDSSTMEYTNNNYGKITTVNGSGLAAIHYDGTATAKSGYVTDISDGYSFHYFEVAIPSVTLRPDEAGIGYKLHLAGNAKVKELLNSKDAYGVTVYIEDGNKSLSAQAGADLFAAGEQQKMVMIKNIFATTNDAATNAAYGEKKVCVKGYIQFGNEMVEVSYTAGKNLQELLSKANDGFENEENSTKRDSLIDFYNTYIKGKEEAFVGWNYGAIASAAEQA